MKKEWIAPEIDSLSVAQTASGNIKNEVPDGPVAYDEEKGTYFYTVGEKSASGATILL